MFYCKNTERKKLLWNIARISWTVIRLFTQAMLPMKLLRILPINFFDQSITLAYVLFACSSQMNVQKFHSRSVHLHYATVAFVPAYSCFPTTWVNPMFPFTLVAHKCWKRRHFLVLHWELFFWFIVSHRRYLFLCYKSNIMIGAFIKNQIVLNIDNTTSFQLVYCTAQ